MKKVFLTLTVVLGCVTAANSQRLLDRGEDSTPIITSCFQDCVVLSPSLSGDLSVDGVSESRPLTREEADRLTEAVQEICDEGAF